MAVARSILLIVCALLAPATAASAQPCARLHVRNPAGNYIIPGVKADIPYSGDLALDAYVQQGSSRPASVIVIHGGGGTSGSRIAHVGQILETLTRGGYNWFSLDYRLGGLPRFEDSLADIRTAVAFIRCHAADLRIDANRLVLLGEDFGANLAASLAAERLPGVTAAVLIGGMYDEDGNVVGIRGAGSGIRGAGSGIRSAGSGIRAAGSGIRGAGRTVPQLVIHGGADGEAPTQGARSYCDRVAQAGQQCEFVEVAGASHRSENWWPTQWHYKQTLIDWLGKLGSRPALPHQPMVGIVRKDIPYRTSPTIGLDAFVAQSRAPGPAIIVVHGGGWEAGDKVTYITPMLEPLARAGLSWFSIDYRLTPAFTHDDQLADLRAAVGFIRTEHTRFNIDPARIILVGESASGQMVAHLATEDRALAGIVSFYGVYDFNAMVTDASPRSLLVRLFRRDVLNDESRAELRRYSPLYGAHKDMAPVLLVNGTGERLWAQAQAFDRRLTELGVKHDLISLDGAPHGMENWEGHREWMFYKQRVIEWIRSIANH